MFGPPRITKLCYSHAISISPKLRSLRAFGWAPHRYRFPDEIGSPIDAGPCRAKSQATANRTVSGNPVGNPVWAMTLFGRRPPITAARGGEHPRTGVARKRLLAEGHIHAGGWGMLKMAFGQHRLLSSLQGNGRATPMMPRGLRFFDRASPTLPTSMGPTLESYPPVTSTKQETRSRSSASDVRSNGPSSVSADSRRTSVSTRSTAA